MRRFALIAVAGIIFSSVVCSTTAAAQASTGVTYLYLHGADTVGRETVSLSPTEWRGNLTMRGAPRIAWIHARTPALNTILIKSYMPDAPPEAEPAQDVAFAVIGDSVHLVVGGAEVQVAPTKAGSIPSVGTSVSQLLFVAAEQLKQGHSSYNVVMLNGGQTLPVTARRAGDTVVAAISGIEVRGVYGSDGLASFIEVPQQQLRAVRISADVASRIEAAARPSYAAPAGAPYIAEDVKIPTGRGYELAATLTKPRAGAPAPVVVTISGSGGQDRDSRIPLVAGYAIFREIADTLGRRGIATLRFDDRGIGQSGGLQSAQRATSADFADDVRSVIAWLRTRKDVDATRIALAGHSEGGMIAPMIAVSDSQIKAIALLAGPAYNGKRILLEQNRISIEQLPPTVSRAERDSIMRSVPAKLDSVGNVDRWTGYFMKYDPLAVARQVRQPTLILQGATDHQITPEQADTLASAMKAGGNRDVTVKTFPATNHLFLNDPSGLFSGYATLTNPHVRPEVLGTLADWMVRVLGVPR